jgi:FdhD protein
VELTNAQAPLTREVTVRDEFGAERSIRIPAERPLTLYVDKQELVTLMTLGVAPELLVLGYLLNQRLIDGIDDVLSISVDWDVSAAAVRTHAGIDRTRTGQRIVTTGCGQGTVFGGLVDALDAVRLPPPHEARISQRGVYAMLETMRGVPSTYRQAGSVHGCALFRVDVGPPVASGSCPQGAQAGLGAARQPAYELLYFVEDVGRHNAIDTIAGWMALHGVAGGDKAFYTTGRLTSEMVMKAAQMGVPAIVSRNGVTQMGYELASKLGIALFGRARNRHFICYCGFDRFDAEPEPAPSTPAPASA